MILNTLDDVTYEFNSLSKRVYELEVQQLSLDDVKVEINSLSKKVYELEVKLLDLLNFVLSYTKSEHPCVNPNNLKRKAVLCKDFSETSAKKTKLDINHSVDSENSFNVSSMEH